MSDIIAKCGMDCENCRFASENNCPGCMQGQVFEDEECEILECCIRKGYEHCGSCPDFPCDELKAVSFDKETGDGGERLMRLKEMHDREYLSKCSASAALLTGTGTGIALGAAVGAISGSFLTWVFAGAVIGCGAGLIIRLAKSRK